MPVENCKRGGAALLLILITVVSLDCRQRTEKENGNSRTPGTKAVVGKSIRKDDSKLKRKKYTQRMLALCEKNLVLLVRKLPGKSPKLFCMAAALRKGFIITTRECGIDLVRNRRLGQVYALSSSNLFRQIKLSLCEKCCGRGKWGPGVACFKTEHGISDAFEVKARESRDDLRGRLVVICQGQIDMTVENGIAVFMIEDLFEDCVGKKGGKGMVCENVKHGMAPWRWIKGAPIIDKSGTLIALHRGKNIFAKNTEHRVSIPRPIAVIVGK